MTRVSELPDQQRSQCCSYGMIARVSGSTSPTHGFVDAISFASAPPSVTPHDVRTEPSGFRSRMRWTVFDLLLLTR